MQRHDAHQGRGVGAAEVPVEADLQPAPQPVGRRGVAEQQEQRHVEQQERIEQEQDAADDGDRQQDGHHDQQRPEEDGAREPHRRRPPRLRHELTVHPLQRPARHQQDQADEQAGEDQAHQAAQQVRDAIPEAPVPAPDGTGPESPMAQEWEHANFGGGAVDDGARAPLDRAADAGDVPVHHRARAEINAAADAHHVPSHSPLDARGAANGGDAVVHLPLHLDRAADRDRFVGRLVLAHVDAAAHVDPVAGSVAARPPGRLGSFGSFRRLGSFGNLRCLGLGDVGVGGRRRVRSLGRRCRCRRRGGGLPGQTEELALIGGGEPLQADHRVGVGAEPVAKDVGVHPLAVDGDLVAGHFDGTDARLGLAGLEHDAAADRQHLVAALERPAQITALLRRGRRAIRGLRGRSGVRARSENKP